jgi:hypothetical protein
VAVIEHGELLCVDVSEEEAIRDRVLVGRPHLPEVANPVKRHLTDTGIHAESAVPRSLWPRRVEAGSLTPVREGPVDDAAKGYTKDEVGTTEARRGSFFLCEQSTVRGRRNPDELVQLVVIVDESRQRRLGRLCVLTGYQTKCVVTTDRGQSWPGQ